MVKATRLSDNRSPTADEWNQACALGREIIGAVNDREAIIARRNLDRAFCLPDANWGPGAPNDYLKAYRLLAKLEWNDVRHLRFRCMNFSGFHLLEQRMPDPGMPLVYSVPDDPILAPAPADHIPLHWRIITEGVPRSRVYQPPHALGEIGWIVPDEAAPDGESFINWEVIAYQERVTLLHRSGVLDRLANLGRPAHILEIGAGYGALACALTDALPSTHYTICDLPESLLFSGLYLNLAARRHVAPMRVIGRGFPAAVELVPNYLFANLADSGREYDLVINVLSMSEMSDHQVATYGQGLRRLLGDSGIFFEQNFSNRHIGFSSAGEVLRGVFPYGSLIETGTLPIAHGPARLWANRELTTMLPPEGLIPLEEPSLPLAQAAG